jgi:hypothetical protein
MMPSRAQARAVCAPMWFPFPLPNGAVVHLPLDKYDKCMRLLYTTRVLVENMVEQLDMDDA